jgi:hypothetical protein
MIENILKKADTASIILIILLPGLFLADILHGILLMNDIDMKISILSIIRGGVFFIAIYVTITNRDVVNKLLFYSILLLLLLSAPGVLISFYHTFTEFPVGYSSLYYEIKEITKVMYGPFLILMYLILLRKKVISKEMIFQYIEYAAYLAGISLFIMQYLGLGEETYAITSGKISSGVKGLFLSQNEISLALSLTLLVALYRNLVTPSLIRFFMFSLSIYALASIGTRTSLLTAALVPMLVIPIILYTKPVNFSFYKNRWIFKMIIIFFIISGLWSGYSVIKNPENYRFQLDRIESVLDGKHPRRILLDYAQCHIAKRGTVKNFLGEGAWWFQHGVFICGGPWTIGPKYGVRLVEVDWMDIYGAYGLGFASLIYILLIYLMGHSFYYFIKYREADQGIISFMIIIYTGHSVIAGHALTSPMPTSILAAVGAIVIFRIKRDSDNQSFL